MTLVKMCDTFVHDMKSLYYRTDTKAEIYAAKRKFVLTAMASAGVGAFFLWNYSEAQPISVKTGEVFFSHLFTAGVLIGGHDLTKVAFNKRCFTIIEHTELSEEAVTIQNLEEIVRTLDLGYQCLSSIMEQSIFQTAAQFLSSTFSIAQQIETYGRPVFLSELTSNIQKMLDGDVESRKWEGTVCNWIISHYGTPHILNLTSLAIETRKWITHEEADKPFVVQGSALYLVGYCNLFWIIHSVTKSRTTYELLFNLTTSVGTTLFCFDCALIKGHDHASISNPLQNLARYQETLLPLPYNYIL